MTIIIALLSLLFVPTTTRLLGPKRMLFVVVGYCPAHVRIWFATVRWRSDKNGSMSMRLTYASVLFAIPLLVFICLQCPFQRIHSSLGHIGRGIRFSYKKTGRRRRNLYTTTTIRNAPFLSIRCDTFGLWMGAPTPRTVIHCGLLRVILIGWRRPCWGGAWRSPWDDNYYTDSYWTDFPTNTWTAFIS